MMKNKQRFFNLATLLLSLTVTSAYAALEGVLDSANCDVIKGWAWDNASPATRIKLDIYDVTATKTTRLTTLTAQLFRQDLFDAGKGDGKYGFSYLLPASIRNAVTHKFSVRYQGTSTELVNSPQTTAIACYGKLNDTNIKSCSNATTNGLACPVTGFKGQDGDYGRDALALAGKLLKTGRGNAGFDFTKIANDGSILPATALLGSGAKDWACTLDNVTGLLWEVKTADGGLRDKDNTYSWYNPDNTSNGGFNGYQNLGTCTGSISCDTQGYIAAVNALKLCGNSGWRVPKRLELSSIVAFGHILPSISSFGYFPNTVSDLFWSSSPVAFNSDFAWVVYFGYGYDGWDPKSYNYYVRLVRSGQ